MIESLRPFFTPLGVAVVGASSNPSKLSYGILENLKQYGYNGKIYPVNPKSDQILGLQCFPDIVSVPDPVDLAVVVLPANFAPQVLRDCAQRGIKAVTIISGGFKEVGDEGEALEKECLAIAREHGIRIIGPNCVGTMDLYSGLNTTFIRGVPDKGGIGFLSQSGAICGGVVDYVKGKGVGFSHFISMGNELDVTETDMIAYLGEDDHVKVIAGYIEAIQDGERFIEVVKEVSRKKPVVLLKAGRSQAGARAVSSHTGSIAGSHAAYQAAFAQSGVIEVNTVSELFDVALAFDKQPLPIGKRTAIITNSGGPAALASDALAAHSFELADLSAGTKEKLRAILNPSAQVSNPVDMLGGAEPHEYESALKAVVEDAGVDNVLTILVPTSLVDPREIARSILSACENQPKTSLSVIFGEESIAEPRKILHANNVPMYIFPETPAAVLGAMARYKDWKNKPAGEPWKAPQYQREVARELLERNEKSSSVGESDTRPILNAYGIPVVEGEFASTGSMAAAIAEKMGYPVVMKIVSPDILHKSDMGGIRLNISDQESVLTAFYEMVEDVQRKMPKARIEGVLIERMAIKGSEVIIGMKRDPSFGPMMMFGLGGIYVELFKDVGFCISPSSREEVLVMIQSTRAGHLLAGLRGQTAADVDAIVEIVLRMADLARDFPQIQEMEINPLRVYDEGQGALALDGRIILG
ncbi:MAG: acetate--CoA ligase family protein [Chloroflexi bacterium]|nr:acetate--CoA ligase family protein [Chloroflexota bacterium]